MDEKGLVEVDRGENIGLNVKGLEKNKMLGLGDVVMVNSESIVKAGVNFRG